MNNVRTHILGCGSYLPERVVTNHDLARTIDTSDEWIFSRTGIRQRHVAADGEFTSDLATRAAERALAHAGVAASEVDLLILGTTTPDRTFPASATAVQAKLGIRQGVAFDLQAACSGFIFGLATADSFIRTGQAQRALVIGAELFSRLVNWDDRATAVLFGDGAGAVVLGPGDAGKGILSTHLHSDGRYIDILCMDGGPSTTRTVGNMVMAGKELFRHAVSNLASVAEETLAANHITPADLDWIVPHQANKRILDGTAKKLGVDESKVVVTVDHHANTSAASIPLALDEAVRDGRIKPGHLVLMESMGGGLTWGAALVRW